MMESKTKNIRFLPLCIGIYIGVGFLMTLDAWISVLQIDMSDSSTWPNMHPWIRLYFIPVIGTALAALVTLIELIKNKLLGSKLLSFFHWFLLGVSYTLFLSFLFLGRILPVNVAVGLVVLVVFTINPFTLQYFVGRIKK